MTAYYNENDPYCAQWLRNLIAAGHLPAGDVDVRDVREVQPDDIRGYTQVHLFAGIGGIPLGLRLGGWSDQAVILTGGFPCQPWSNSGKRKGARDDRDLWPEMARLIEGLRPDWVLGENVPGIVNQPMGLDRVLSDLEDQGYTTGTALIPACSVSSPHKRERVWIVAHGDTNGTDERGQGRGIHNADGDGASPQCGRELKQLGPRGNGDESPVAHGLGNGGRGQSEHAGIEGALRDQLGGCGEGGRRDGENVADSESDGRGQGHQDATGGADGGREEQGTGLGGCSDGGEDVGNTTGPRWNGGTEKRGKRTEEGKPRSATRSQDHWSDHAIIGGRRVKPGVRLLAHGIPNRVAKLRAFGNAVVPQVVAEIVKSMMLNYEDDDGTLPLPGNRQNLSS